MKPRRPSKKSVPSHPSHPSRRPLVLLVHNVAVNPSEVISLFGRGSTVEVRMTNGVTYTIPNTTVASVLEKFS